jgi:D-alanyl-D-alanine carboxypeptidase
MLDFLLAILFWLSYEWIKNVGYDLNTDSSLTKFVNNEVYYNDIKYTPINLVSLKWEFILDSKWNSKVRKITLKKLKLLSEKFHKDFWKKLKVVSAHRDYNYQKRIKDWGCPDLFCAKAWYSEHQSGLAIDFWEATHLTRYKKDKNLKKYFDWMKINWVKFGFINTYIKWKEIDGYAVEPWHWRYVWEGLAEYLYENDLTFAEYYYKRTK